MKKVITKEIILIIICSLTVFVSDGYSQFKVKILHKQDWCLDSYVSLFANPTGGTPPYQYTFKSIPNVVDLDQQPSSIAFILKDTVTLFLTAIDNSNAYAYDTMLVAPMNGSNEAPRTTLTSKVLECSRPVYFIVDSGYLKYDFKINGNSYERTNNILEILGACKVSVRAMDSNYCWSKYSDTYEITGKLYPLDTLFCKLHRTTNALSDTFAFDFTYKIRPENLHCLPDTSKLILTQFGDNIFCIEPDIEEIIYSDDKTTKDLIFRVVLDDSLVTKRIKFINIIGHTGYSEILSVKNESRLQFQILRGYESWKIYTNSCYLGLLEVPEDKVKINAIYPNPSTSEVTVEYEIIEETNFKMFITDLSGRQFLITEQESRKPGIYTELFVVDELHPGFYMIVFYNNGSIISRIIEVI